MTNKKEWETKKRSWGSLWWWKGNKSTRIGKREHVNGKIKGKKQVWGRASKDARQA